MYPLVSVIVPCYNQAHFLDDCLESVINQKYSNWECLVVDDGSPDNTFEVTQKWIAKDVRIKYLSKENGGLASARNFGIKNALGKYILPLDSDDKISAEYIALAVEYIQSNKNCKVVYAQAMLFGQKEGPWYLADFSLQNLAKQNMIFCTALFSKDSWEKVGGYDETIRDGFEDWDFWISLLKNGGDVYKLPVIGFYYRIRDLSMSRSIDRKKFHALTNHLAYKHFDFFSLHLGNIIEAQEIITHYNILTKNKVFIFLKKIKSLFRLKRS